MSQTYEHSHIFNIIVNVFTKLMATVSSKRFQHREDASIPSLCNLLTSPDHKLSSPLHLLPVFPSSLLQSHLQHPHNRNSNPHYQNNHLSRRKTKSSRSRRDSSVPIVVVHGIQWTEWTESIRGIHVPPDATDCAELGDWESEREVGGQEDGEDKDEDREGGAEGHCGLGSRLKGVIIERWSVCLLRLRYEVEVFGSVQNALVCCVLCRLRNDGSRGMWNVGKGEWCFKCLYIPFKHAACSMSSSRGAAVSEAGRLDVW
jgi:hypothetical protein